ncbi:MAG: DUF2934 domain-containing protein [Deltaproteobacteria bacterium]|nr:DUF2934 domain-containing protein [Deltaproteobacteria bacterium]MBF0523825.1 DUF2934 domain-containing protein [Deltaproteobacteria bacterium]
MIESAAYELFKREGREEGREEGRKEGIKQGVLNTSRENLMNVLEAHFGTIPAKTKTRINRLDDPAILKQLILKAVTAASVDHFYQELDQLVKK